MVFGPSALNTSTGYIISSEGGPVRPRQDMVARLSSSIWQSEIRGVTLHLFQ